MKYGFFEKVKIISSDKFPASVGRIGIVIGVSEDESKVYGYAISFLEGDEGLFFVPEELQGTGEFVDRSLLYDENDRIKVKVKDGKGEIV
jgi:hypothetical protein